MARDLGLRHREAHVGEEAALAPLGDVPLRVGVALGPRGPDDVDAELLRQALELYVLHPTIVPPRRESCSFPGTFRRLPGCLSNRCQTPILSSGSFGPGCSRPLRAAGAVRIRSPPVKAIRIHEDGGPEVLRYEDAPDPEPADDEVLIRLRAASLNHLDVWVRKGLPSVQKPRILGADGAGVVEAAGNGFEAGQRVVINPGVIANGRMQVVGEAMDGTHAELVAIPARNVYAIPDELSFEEAAAFPLVFETAHPML